MKRKGFVTMFAVIAVLISCMAFFVSCGNTPEDAAPKEYTIQYTDGVGTHQITVTEGMPYALDVIPEMVGYTFTGLYDAEVGGTKYISETGASLSPFTDGKNLVLFPQFKAKEYTVILDYQGAEVTGSRQLTVAYGSNLPELPKNLTGEHKEFVGWYTQANCEGTQIADEYGLIPVVSVLNDTNFDVSGEYIYLYAGFEIEKFTVTCCFEAGMDTEDVQVEYDTPVSQIVPETRLNGQAPLTWSKTQGGEVFNGKVTDDMVLYAAEYAPVIELDSNGGSKVKPVVARPGSTVSLPTPTKDLAKFVYWEDMQGNRYDSTTMPSTSISLKAVWQAKLVFDENGGSDVDDISVPAGEAVTLPSPEKDGFIFAGWYTAEKERYTSTKMPAAGIKLKAGWYKAKEETIIIRSADDKSYSINYTYNVIVSETNTVKGPNANMREVVDLSSYIPASGSTIKIELNYKMRMSTEDTVFQGGFYFYDDAIVSDANYLGRTINNEVSGEWKSYIYSGKFSLRSNTLYLCYYSKSSSNAPSGYANTYINFSDIWMKLIYPDTTNLYL